MKKLLIGLCIFLTACSSSGEETAVEIKEGNFETSNFSLYVPEEWEIINSQNFTPNVPADIVSVFRSNIKSDIFTATVSISETPLPPEVDTVTFHRSSLQKVKGSLVGFQEISRVEGERTVVRFQGKRNASDPMLEHIRVIEVKDGLGYIATATFLELEDESIVNTAIQMLDSFSLK